MASEGSYFYKDEIVPDFQTRQKAALAGKESIPNDLSNKIGMPTINPKSNVKKYLVECVSLSSLHGFNHLVAPNRHPVERFMSFLVIAGCLSCLILLSSIFWERYQNEAITIAVSLDLDEFKLLKLSLFICPVDNIVRSKIPEVFKRYGIEHTPEAEEFFTFLSNVSYDNVHETPYYDKFPAENWTDVLYDLKKDISPNVLSVNDPHETWVWTERGLCFATRSMTAKFYSMENWRKQNMPLQDGPFNFPYYPSDNKILEKFRVEHTSMISLLDPLEYLIFETPRNLVESKMLHSAIVQTYRSAMHVSLKSLSVRQRGCKMIVDGGLPTVPFYTESACYAECRMREILMKCHCRPHFAKPIDGQMTCSAAELRCIGRIKHKLFIDGFAPESCDCLEKCNEHVYVLKPTASTAMYCPYYILVIQIRYDVIREIFLMNSRDNAPINSTVMTLEIKRPTVIYSRELSYDLSSFLSSIGGAAGLFMGGSVLSFVELFYFVTLRLYFRTKEVMAKRRKKLSLFKYFRGRK